MQANLRFVLLQLVGLPEKTELQSMDCQLQILRLSGGFSVFYIL